MKHNLLILSMISTIISPLYAGGSQSSEQKHKVKIADLRTLRDRMLEEPDLNNDTLLERIDFFEKFADQRFSAERLPAVVDQVFDGLWQKRETINADIPGAWERVKEQRKADFETNKSKIKPAIFRVLLKDHPTILSHINHKE